MEKLLTSLENFKYLCQGKAGVIYYNNEAGTLEGPDVDMLQYLLHSAESGRRLQLRSNVKRYLLGEGHFSAVFTHENSQNETIKIFKGYYGDEAAYRYLRLCGNCWNAVDKSRAAWSTPQEGTQYVSEHEGHGFEKIYRKYMPKVRAIGKIAVVEPGGRCYTAAYAIMPKYYPVKAESYPQEIEQRNTRESLEADFYEHVKCYLPNANGDIHSDNVMCTTQEWDPNNMVLTDPVYSREKLTQYSQVELPADFRKHCPVRVKCTADANTATQRWLDMVPPDLVELAHMMQAPIQAQIHALRTSVQWVGPKMPELQAMIRDRGKSPTVKIQPIQDAWDAMQFFGELK